MTQEIISVDTEADSGDDSEDDSEDSTGDPGTASGFYDEPSSDGFSSDISDTNQGGFSDGAILVPHRIMLPLEMTDL